MTFCLIISWKPYIGCRRRRGSGGRRSVRSAAIGGPRSDAVLTSRRSAAGSSGNAADADVVDGDAVRLHRIVDAVAAFRWRGWRRRTSWGGLGRRSRGDGGFRSKRSIRWFTEGNIEEQKKWEARMINKISSRISVLEFWLGQKYLIEHVGAMLFQLSHIYFSWYTHIYFLSRKIRGEIVLLSLEFRFFEERRGTCSALLWGISLLS